MRKDTRFSEKIFTISNVIIMLLFAAICIYPFYYMLIYAFSASDSAYGITLLPRDFTLNNFVEVVRDVDIGLPAVVSVVRTLLGTSVTVLSCSFFGYLMTKQRMPGRKFFYRMLVITMYVNGGLIPTYLVYQAYGLVNSFLIYILPTALTAYNVMLVKTFTESIPESLEESAVIDGAGPIKCWWSLIFPLSKPILATITVFAAVFQWNDWFDTHIYITKQNMWPLQYVLYRYLQKASAALEAAADSATAEVVVTPATIRMTITAIVTIPILFVYPFMQKYFMKGMLLGAVKG